MGTALRQKPVVTLNAEPNLQDRFVIQDLISAPLGQLPVDQCANLLCREGGAASNEDVARLRRGLIETYFNAAQLRWEAKATSVELACARRALGALTKAVTNLDNVASPMQRGLRAAFGPPADDVGGVQEVNAFQSACRRIRFNVIPPMMELWQLVDAEAAKSAPAKTGERKKRLRILVEELADWWIAETGKTLAPYVRAKRLDHRPAFVMGREGPFLSLGMALFCKVDRFNESEVIAAVTNVHEDYLAKRKNPEITAQ